MAKPTQRLGERLAPRFAVLILVLGTLGLLAHPPQPETEEFDLDAVLSELKGDNRALQLRAAQVLSRRETLPPWMAEEIGNALSPDADERLRCDLWVALGATGEISLPRFRSALRPSRSPDHAFSVTYLQRCVVRGLSRLAPRSEEVRGLLRATLDDLNRDIGIDAAKGLWNAGPPAHLIILDVLAHGTPEVKDRLLFAHEDLELRLRDELAGAISAGLRDADPRIRGWCALILARHERADDRVIGILIDALDLDPHWFGYSRVTWMLGELGNRATAAVPALIRSIESHGASPIALGKIGTPEAANYLRNALSDGNKSELLPDIARALGAIGPPAKASIPDLVMLLGNDSATIRSAAAEGLAGIGEAAIAELLAALKSDDMYVRTAAAEALYRMETSRDDGVAALLEALRDPYPMVRRYAGLALFRIEDPEIREAHLRISKEMARQEEITPVETGATIGSVLLEAEARADLPPTSRYRFAATLESWQVFQTPAGELIASRHRGPDRAEVLRLWAPVSQGYRLLERVESSEVGASYFEVTETFRHSGAFFIRSKERYAGTGNISHEHIWEVEPDYSLIPAEFERGSEIQASLKPGEEFWKGPALLFEDDSVTFTYLIWRTGGAIKGSYKFTKVRDETMQTSKWLISVDMVQRIEER